MKVWTNENREQNRMYPASPIRTGLITDTVVRLQEIWKPSFMTRSSLLQKKPSKYLAYKLNYYVLTQLVLWYSFL